MGIRTSLAAAGWPIVPEQQIVVVGAGLMGSGIAQVAAAAGYAVDVVDVDDAAFSRARVAITDSQSRLHRKRPDADAPDVVLRRIRFATDLDVVTGASLVIEAVFEDLKTKRGLFRRLDELCSDSCLLASNTSAIPISSIAAHTRRPERVIGMHFFSPVPVMQLCEVVLGDRTDEATLAAARRFAERVGKTVIVVRRDNAGFVTSRLGAALCNEAVRLLEEGVASSADIDAACRLGFGHPMGPFELMDLTGLDVQLGATEAIRADGGDDHFVPPRTLRRMVEGGRLGRKAGHGWYDYAQGRP
jgi:3-hydroxybutyryl-CoA dehydrogenase